MERIWKILFIYPFPALLTPLPILFFNTEENNGCAIEGDKGVNKDKRTALLFLYPMFYCFSNSIN